MPSKLTKHELERERLIFRYIRALEQDDEEDLALVLEAALEDPELATTLDEVDRALLEEAGLPSAVEKETVATLAELHLGSLDAGTSAPLTIGHVAARLKDRNRIPIGSENTNKLLLTLDEVIPSELTVATVESLLRKTGIVFSSAYARAFRTEAVRLSMSRSEGPARIAARSRRRPKS